MKQSKMKCLFLVACLFAAILVSGCSSEIEIEGKATGTPTSQTVDASLLPSGREVPLTDEKAQEIKDSWHEKNESNFVWEEYYGTYDDSVVFLDPTNLTRLTTKKVANYEFKFGSSFIIWVYQNGEFYKLEEAYENGVMTEAQVAAVFDSHADYLKGKFGEEYYNALYGVNL